MRSEIASLFFFFWGGGGGRAVVFLSSVCVCVIINTRSFEPFMCLDLVLERYQSFLFQIFFLPSSLSARQQRIGGGGGGGVGYKESVWS